MTLAPPSPRPRLRLALWAPVALLWWGLVAVVALAWGHQLAWRQAHLQAQGQAPGGELRQARILVLKHYPAHDRFEASNRLLVALPGVGVVPLARRDPRPAEWREGGEVTLRQAPHHPSVRAFDLPEARAFSALDYWSQTYPARSDVPYALLPALSLGGALGATWALAMAWGLHRQRLWAQAWAQSGRWRPALHLAVAALCLTAAPQFQRMQDQMDEGQPEGLVATHSFGPAMMLRVLSAPAPGYPDAVRVLVPEGHGVPPGPQLLPVGHFAAQHLRPQQWVRVLPNPTRGQLVYAERVPAMEHRLPFLQRFWRALAWGRWLLWAQAALSLALALGPWLWRLTRRRALARAPAT